MLFWIGVDDEQSYYQVVLIHMNKTLCWPKMLSSSIVPLPKSALPSQQVLRLSNIYLADAARVVDNNNDHDIALMLCHNAEVTLSQVTNKKAGYKAVLGEVIAAYNNLSNLLKQLGYTAESQKLLNKTEKWR